MTDQFVARDPVERLAEEFMARFRRGERPPLSEYTAAHPDLADEIRDLFPALVLMEEVKPAGTDPPRSAHGHDTPPDRLGDYRILREVARGGMGVVYEAEQVALGRHVALKILPAQPDGDPLRLLRFRREARSAARLHHTNIIPVFDVGAADGVHYYAMQFIQGQGLDEVLQELIRLRTGAKATDAPALTVSLAEGLQTGTFVGAPIVPVPKPAGSSPTEPSAILTGPVAHYFRSVARIGVQAADALAYAHGQRVLHRDVKPSNLLLDRQGTLWLTDFGLAKDDGDDLTRTGDIVGTLRYMAPERFQGVSDPRSDVYALGVTLYELLTLRPAFPEADRVRLIHQVAKQDPPRPRLIDPTIPRDLETVVLKAIEKDPARRYPRAVDLAEDLRRVLADRPVLARRVSWREHGWRWCRRNPGLAASLSAAAALLILGTGISTWQAVRATRAEGLAATRLEAEKQERERAVEAERDRKRQLVGAKLAQARAGRWSRQPGQRFDGWKTLAEAAALARELELDEPDFKDLRDEAVSCLAVADVRLLKEWDNPTELVNGEGLAFDGDLHHYASSDVRGDIEIRRVGDAQLVVRLPRPWPTGAGSAADLGRFSPDGRLLAVRHRVNLPVRATNVQVWDWRQSRVVFRPPFRVAPDHTIAFSPDGRHLALAQEDGTVTVHETGTWTDASRFKTERRPHVLAFHPGGARLAVAHNHPGARIQVWDLATTTVLQELRSEIPISGLAWDPSGSLLAAPTARRVTIWDAGTGRIHVVLDGHGNDVHRVAFAGSGDLVFSASFDGSSRGWDPWTGHERIMLAGSMIAVSRDGLRVVSSGGQLALWDVTPSKECRQLPVRPLAGRESVNRPDFGPEGQWLAASVGHNARLWDLRLWTQVASLPGSAKDIKVHPNGHELFTSGADGVYRWPLAQEEGVLRIGLPEMISADESEWAALDRAGQRLVVGDADGARSIELANPPGPAPLRLNHRRAFFVTASPDGRWVTTGGFESGTLKVWDVQTRKPLPEPGPGAGLVGVFSPDGRWLVTLNYREVRIWELHAADAWRMVRQIRRAQWGSPCSAAFSPDGKVLALQTALSEVQLLDVGTWHPMVRLAGGGADPLGELAFSPDGSRLVVTSGPGVRMWDLRRIRVQLRQIGLDWEQADYPSARPVETGRPVRVEIAAGASGRLALSGPARVFEATARILAARPGDRAALLDRGGAYSATCEWAKAAADLARGVAGGNPSESWVQLAGLHLLAGDIEAYGKVCQGLSSASTRTKTFYLAYLASRVHGLGPSTVDPAQMVGWAESAVREGGKTAWHSCALGRAQYRGGKFEESVRSCKESLDDAGWPGRPLNWLVLAMAHRRLDQPAAAEAWLSKYREWLDGTSPGEAGKYVCPQGMICADWVECHVLHREAEALWKTTLKKK